MKKQNTDLYEKIKNVLIKKAEGFFYNEEILEYTTEDGKIKKVTVIAPFKDGALAKIKE